MPQCDRTGCGQTATVQWRRRSAADPGHTIAIYSCHDDAIHVDLAAQVHAANCTAPNPAHLPACSCEPEPLPDPEPDIVHVTLPTGWTVPASFPEDTP